MGSLVGQTVRYECVVHKANVPLASGESLSKYMSGLGTAGGTYIKKQLNLNSLAKPAYAGAYMLEAYSDKCVFDVYKYGGPDTPGDYRYYAVNYTRKANGDFEFKDLTEVERVTSYQAKPSLSITKGAKAKKEDDEEEEEMAKSPKSTTKKAAEFMPGWVVATAKNAVSWDGIL